MTPHRTLRPLLAVAVALSVLGGGAALAAPKAPKLGPNLAPNASFEQGNDATIVDGNYNPVPPTGWAYEGADRPVRLQDERQVEPARRSVAISGALGGGKQAVRRQRGPVDRWSTCAPNPAYAVTSQADRGTRKTLLDAAVLDHRHAIAAVTAGKTYRFSAYAGPAEPRRLTPACQARERRRRSAGWTLLAPASPSARAAKLVKVAGKRSLGFKLATADLKAPAGAAGAVLMLGHTEYTHTGAQVAFDDVSFQAIG